MRTDSQRTTYPVTLEGSRRRVLVLSTSLLLGNPGQPGQPGHTETNEGGYVPVSRPSFSNSTERPAGETGTISREKLDPAPTVPVVPVSCGIDGKRCGPVDDDRQQDPDEEVFSL